MDVHVFVFEHRHGRDITVHASTEAAYEAAAKIARRDWAEARQSERTLPASPPADDIEAVEMYFEAREGHEFYAIVSCEIEGIGAAAGTS
jgi:hypothetical protein